MKVQKAALTSAVFSLQDLPGECLPEIAFVGRSNVGKSSLINCLLGRKKLARTSSTPGKTRALFFYLLDDTFYFVDLPGYGYARVSKEVRYGWGPLIEHYLSNRKTLKGCVHLVDCRLALMENDLLMRQWLLHRGIPVVTVLTKADKLSRGGLAKQATALRKQLHIREDEPLVPCSASTGRGRDELWRLLTECIK